MRHQRQQRRHFARDRGGRRGRLPRGGGGGVGGRRGHDDDDYDGNKDGPRRGGGDDGRTRSHDDDVELGSTRRNSSSRYEERSYLDRDDRVVYRRHGARDDEHDEYDRDGTGGRKNVLVIGSSGVLGRAISSHFARGCKWNVLGADVVGDDDDEKEGGGSLLREYVRLPDGGSLSDLAGALVHGVSAYVRGGEGGMKGRTSSSSSSLLDAVVIASGGWAGDVPFVAHDVYDDEDGAKQAMRNAEICERMIRMNYFPVVAGSLVGPRFVKRGGAFFFYYTFIFASPSSPLERSSFFPLCSSRSVENPPTRCDAQILSHSCIRALLPILNGLFSTRPIGLFVMIGASAALSPTPGMLGYGSAKSAAHHYLRSLGPGMRESSDITAVGVLPLMLDTPANRAMFDRGGEIEEDGKYSKMVKPMHIANEIGEWIKNPRLRPHSGSLVKVIAKNRRDGSGGAAFHLVR